MYIAFLSYNQLNEYLSILIENNLIEYLDGTKTFRTPEKGLFFLKNIFLLSSFKNKCPTNKS
jgi:predicted transcriptional regulator